MCSPAKQRAAPQNSHKQAQKSHKENTACAVSQMPCVELIQKCKVKNERSKMGGSIFKVDM
jgi:hypothetical protein